MARPGLKLQEPLRWIDNDPPRRKVDFLDDLLDSGDKMFFLRPLDNIKLAARGRPDPGDHADRLSRKSVNFETYDLIVIVLPRRQRSESICVDAEDSPDPFLRVVDSVDAPQLDENLALIPFARFEILRRSLAVFFENQLAATS